MKQHTALSDITTHWQGMQPTVRVSAGQSCPIDKACTPGRLSSETQYICQDCCFAGCQLRCSRWVSPSANQPGDRYEERKRCLHVLWSRMQCVQRSGPAFSRLCAQEITRSPHEVQNYTQTWKISVVVGRRQEKSSQSGHLNTATKLGGREL